MTTGYTLQYSSCVGRKSNGEEQFEGGSLVFNTLYTGDQLQFLMNDVDIYHTYYFRVCKNRTGAGCDLECEPWSIARKGFTTLPPYGKIFLR